MVLSVGSGHSVDYLTGAVGGGRENYYSGAVAAGEPPGIWYGKGAELLGLSGKVDAAQMEDIYSRLLDPRDPAREQLLGKAHKNYRSSDEVYAAALEREPLAGPERRAQLRADAEAAARQPVAFLDATFNAPKSVSVMGAAFERAANEARATGDLETAAAYDAHAKAVEEAVMAGARAAIDYLEQHAGYARVGHHGGGAGQWIDAHKFIVAQFLQHDSREKDPHLHVHQAILNRVLGADGQWRALDSRAIHACKGAASAVGERVMEAYLTRALGVRFETRPDGKAREVVGVRQEIRDMFSARRQQITAKAEKLIGAFRDRFGREPSALERDRLSRQATMATRRAKSHVGENNGQRLDRWAAEAHAVMRGGLAEVARHVLGRAQQADPAATWDERDVIERALETVTKGRQSDWSRHDLTRAISDELPGHLGVDIDTGDVSPLLEGLTDRALEHAVVTRPGEDTTGMPAWLLREDGRSVFETPGGARYATRGQMAAALSLRAAAVQRGAARLSDAEAADVVSRFAESGVELGADQAAAVRGVLTSGARVETLLAAAGTGKSFTVSALADTWVDGGRRVFGLAPSEVATDVLREETITARNVAAWLTTQARLDNTEPGGSDPGGDGQWRLQAGDLVVVDEAGMTSTIDLAEINRRCDAAGAKLLLVGDPRQLAAIGPGGALADIAAHGISYELAEVRRFGEQWERTASLQLRDGAPAALDAYQRHGRLVDGGTAEQAEAAAARGWLADTLAGREALLLVSSNAAAARASAALRADLVALGRVEEAGVQLGREGTVAGVGDLVQARRNGWQLRGWEGNGTAPVNRTTYRVTALRADGGLTVAPVVARGDDGEQLGAPIQLPVSYVAEDLTLGYASTVHSAQGRTVDTAHAVIGGGTDAAGAYVAMTRGRDRNTAYGVTQAVPDDAPTGEVHDTQQRTARAVLTDVLDQAEQQRSALAEQERADLDARSTITHGDRLIEVVGRCTAGRTATMLDTLVAEGALSADDRFLLAADTSRDSLDRVLRTAELGGHDPHVVLRDAVAERGLDDAHSPAQVIYSRITQNLTGQPRPDVTSFAGLIPADVADQDRTWLTARAENADTRRRELGTETAEHAPQWAREALGDVPSDPLQRAEWEHRAGWAAAHRELAGHADEADPLGSAPPAGLAEKHAIWRTAHAALGLPDRGAEEADLSDGRLRLRVHALEREQTWAPRWVGDELAATHHDARRHRTDAEVWSARAEAAADATERDTLRAEAQHARAEADALTERAEQLETADEARAEWFASTAVTRDMAARARAELGARGIDLNNPAERVTAAEWLEADRAERVTEDPHRVVSDNAELLDVADDPVAAPVADTTEAVAEDAAPVAETAVPDVRDTSVTDASEHADPAQRHRVPTADETTADVARAQQALAEIEARREADAAREAREAAEGARREELARWSEQDHAAEQATHDADDRDDALTLER
ncbi:MAG: relaxase domain-containing protein [Pseudonocardiaceae bacterium]|nr:relaxase domain-containing protein [Pseudonocardiaceae bacterium]